jgi:O-6-methylguanine DNA methyltransferase
MDKENKVVYYTVLDIEPIKLLIAATEEGICKIDFGIKEEFLLKWIQSNKPECKIVKDSKPFSLAAMQIEQYFKKKREIFTVKLDVIATQFQKKVYNEMLEIPYGGTVTYKHIAMNVGGQGYSRAVGNAANKNPIPIIIPCHRVIGSDGSLTGFGGGVDLKERLLKLEER